MPALGAGALVLGASLTRETVTVRSERLSFLWLPCSD